MFNVDDALKEAKAIQQERKQYFDSIGEKYNLRKENNLNEENIYWREKVLVAREKLSKNSKALSLPNELLESGADHLLVLEVLDILYHEPDKVADSDNLTWVIEQAKAKAEDDSAEIRIAENKVKIAKNNLKIAECDLEKEKAKVRLRVSGRAFFLQD